ncbi:MAG: GNAT family N-acetyltransferase [Bacilli bacterium]|nr:GNAT family N-acetyltransferase [Bacilli bacterium]
MITQPNNLEEVSPILKKYFHGYQISSDPFEKVAVYNDNNIIGIISYSIIYGRGEINYIITLPTHRKQGIGSQLLEYAINDMKNNNCTTISLEVESNNIEAINLYSKYGFQKQAIRSNYYQGKDAYLMIKEIEVIK